MKKSISCTEHNDFAECYNISPAHGRVKLCFTRPWAGEAQLHPNRASRCHCNYSNSGGTFVAGTQRSPGTRFCS